MRIPSVCPQLVVGLVLIVLSLDSTPCLCATSQAPVIKMSVCKLRSRQYRTSSKVVEVEAEVYNGSPHGLFLGDESCPKQRLQVDYETNAADESVLSFDKFISHNVGNLGLIAKGRFLGVLIRDRKTRRAYFSIRKVLDLKRNRTIGDLVQSNAGQPESLSEKAFEKIYLRQAPDLPYFLFKSCLFKICL